jgi:MoaA/NifB/PqqE/SkfB family radical SAM enzyme
LLNNKSIPKYILDGHKLAWHTDRIEAWEAGERIAPISIDMALTRACQASCRGCYAMLQESQERNNISADQALHFVDDCATIGVKSISLISDGESTLSKAYIPFIQHASSSGIDVGNATNGWILTPDKAEQVLPHLTWIRFTVLAGRPQTYVRMMHHDPSALDIYWTAMHNISEAVRIKRRNGLGVTIGIQTFVTPDDQDEVRAFAQLAIDLGVDYAVIKHTSDDELGSLEIEYDKYNRLETALIEAEAMSTPQTQIIVKWSKIRDGNKAPYKRVYGMAFLLQISGSGLIAPSGMFFNSRYSKLHIGDFTQERFIDIWRSDRYWDTMAYLASPAFDAQTMMGSLPISHYANVALDRHVRGVEKIRPSSDPKPPHVNFV